MEKKLEVYAFIDSQNLNMGVSNDIIDKDTSKILYKGWKLDFSKFRLYLKNKYGVTEAYLFIGNKPGNESMYNALQESGFNLILKPTLPYKKDGVMNTKGNVDAELVLYASAILYEKYDEAIIVSGDGDFLCLAEHLDNQGKLKKILTPNFRYSSLLNKFADKILVIGKLKSQLEYFSRKK